MFYQSLTSTEYFCVVFFRGKPCFILPGIFTFYVFGESTVSTSMLARSSTQILKRTNWYNRCHVQNVGVKNWDLKNQRHEIFDHFFTSMYLFFFLLYLDLLLRSNNEFSKSFRFCEDIGEIHISRMVSSCLRGQ